ncbi:MAG TPA: arylsulfotransferase family protein [Thermoleophilaceae bacterium]|nr:arylsulfotransferase family protein [Thermoleophilaceae bacterium]
MRARSALGAAAAAIAVAALPAAAQAVSWNREVKSVPGLRIPRVWVTVNDQDKAPGFMFLTPRAKLGQSTGPTILNADGKVVWFHRLSPRRTASGLQPQIYRGKPVLVWGQRPPLVHEGDSYRGAPHTVYNVIADTSYRIIARIRARGHGVRTDLHEFRISKRDTALVLGWRVVDRDLRRYGGTRHSAVLDNVVQEIDIRTGRVLLNFSAARRISPRQSYVRPPKDAGAWDAYHVNSITEDTDGNLLLTSRHMSAVYKIDRRTGRVMWKLGGRGGDFKLSNAARFYYPHDAQRAPDGTITILDNHAGPVTLNHASRALRLRVNTRRHTVSLARSFPHPAGNVSSTSQGNVNQLANGDVFVGWGISPWFSEYAADGRILFAAHFKNAWSQSYRAFKADWHATPTGAPAIYARVTKGNVAAYVSWNGATEVASWRLLGGPDQNNLTTLVETPWADFETKLSAAATPAFVKAQALDANGNVLGESAPVAPNTT